MIRTIKQTQNIIALFILISCQSAKQEEITSMRLEVEITREGNNAYTIAWYDTLGKSQNLNKFNRPFHIECIILDQHDTAGYYYGLSSQSTWTSFGTPDSIVSVYFSIARNPFSGMAHEQQMEYPDISCNFHPVQLKTTSRLEERIELVLNRK